MLDREKQLAVALLWLRNHYDVEPESEVKSEVLRRIDAVLADGPELSIVDMSKFREKYPSEVMTRPLPNTKLGSKKK